MKTIVFLVLHLGYGGIEKSIATQANMLCEQYNIEIISVYKLYDKPAFEINDKVKIRYLIKDLKPNQNELINAIKSKNIKDILKQVSISLKVLYLRKLRMIKAIREINANYVISSRMLFNKWLVKNNLYSAVLIAQEHKHHNGNQKYVKQLLRSLKGINFFMPVSKSLTDFYSEKLKSSSIRCIYIPHSLDSIPEFSYNPNAKQIISVGRLSPEKGYVDLIEVFALVLKNHSDWKINIIGDGSELEKIQNKILEYNIKDSVLLHGYQSKEYIFEIMRNSSIYVMTSFEESFGLVLIEAQSFGLPCIAFDSAQGASEIISDQVNGYLISNRSKENMVKALNVLIENKNIMEKFSKKSFENAQNFSCDKIKNQWLCFLENI